ncbi:MAG: hypothetical protein R3321_02600 [Nitrososphaeraceae archaeon]|nr:hypothetical protein [Nitrososphaeraceae archaeon]
MKRQELITLIKGDPRYPELDKDLRAEITAPIRNTIHNLKEKIFNRHNVEGFVGVRVRRSLKNSRGIPIDKDGKEILNPDEYATRCVYNRWVSLENKKHNIITTNGRDWVHEQIWTNASAGSAEQAAHEVAVTSDATGTDAADDALPSEITTGGLVRKNADQVNHTDDTDTTTLVTTYTASATHNNVQMAGTFYVPTSATGQLILENTFTSTNLVSSDQLELTWTITTG